MNLVPYRLPLWIQWLYPSLRWRIATNEKKIYLTFDDGPVPGPTEFVLDQLRAFQAKATFFVIGDNVQRHPDLFLRILEEGHRYGNHTCHHTNGWKVSTNSYLDEVQQFHQLLPRSTQSKETPTPLFRPPYGRISRHQIRAILPTHQIVMWEVLTHDYNTSIDPEIILQKSIKATRVGSIVVFHDSYKAEKNLRQVLPDFLRHFHERGYSFDVLPSFS